MKTIAEQIEDRMQLAAEFEARIGAARDDDAVERETDIMDVTLTLADRRIMRRLAEEEPTAADAPALFDLFAWLMDEATMGRDDVLDTAAAVEDAIRDVLAELADCRVCCGVMQE